MTQPYTAVRDDTGWFVETPEGEFIALNLGNKERVARDLAMAMNIGRREIEARREWEAKHPQED